MTHVLPDVKKFLDGLNQAAMAKGRENIEVFRKSVDDTFLIDAPAVQLPVMEDMYGEGADGQIKFRLYDRTPTRTSGPVMVYFHGGGCVAGGIKSHEPICTELADYLNIPVVLPEYRLAPEHPWPAAPNDCEAFCRWIATSPIELGFEVTGLILCGDSGGGTLTVITAQSLRDNPADVPVILQVPMCPLLDQEGHYESRELFKTGYFYVEDATAFYRSLYKPNMNHPKATPMIGEHHNMPPTLLVVAGLDMARDASRRYAQELIKHGARVVYFECPGIVHGFPVLRKVLPSAKIYIDQVMAMITTMIES